MAFMPLGREPRGGLVQMPDNFMQVHSAPIISLVTRNNVPAVYTSRYWVRDGGLLSYGPDFEDMFRRAAPYVAFSVARSRATCQFNSTPARAYARVLLAK
jgi:putative ABC transport system substrate-binding protein